MSQTTTTAQRDPILNEVFEKVKKAALARALHVSRPAISQWKRVPDEHVRVVAALTGISLKRLRPDLYDPAFQKPQEAGAVVTT